MTHIQVLEEIVLKCGKLVLSERARKHRGVKNKKEQRGQHYSLRADRRSLILGSSILRRHFPNELLVAEEKKNEMSVPPDCTVFDPNDGTSNLLNGLDDFGVTICTLRAGRPFYGATYFPVSKILVSVVRGKGCYLGGFGLGKRIRRIAWHGHLDKIQIGTDIGPWVHSQHTYESVLRPLSRSFNIQSAMSAIEGGRRVLMGNTAVYYNFGIAKIWDAAAMALAIEEAGGFVSAPDGSPITWNCINLDWVMAINQELAKVVLRHARKWQGRR